MAGTPLVDLIRFVPELAVRIALGASVKRSGDFATVKFQGEEFRCDLEAFRHAVGIAKALSIDNSPVNTVADVLKLRHKAEDLFIESLLIGTSSIPQILFVPAGNVMASAIVRARGPAEVMTDRRLAIAHCTDCLDLSKALRYQILWIQLSVNPILYLTAVRAKAAGVKIVYDVDDKFDAIPPENPAAAVYVEQKQADVWRMIELADMVTVSTNDLANHIRPRNPNVRVIANEIPASLWPRAAAKPADHVKILWAGSPTHKRDLDIVAPALLKILMEGQGKVRFTCFGDQPPAALAPAAKYIDLMKFVPIDEYGDALASVGAHLAIAPLEKNPFNDAKSAIKYLEYSACGYPSLLSPVGEYPELPAEAPRIMVADQEWEKALRYALGDLKGMEEMGERAKVWTRDNRCVIKSSGKKWAEVANEISEQVAR